MALLSLLPTLLVPKLLAAEVAPDALPAFAADAWRPAADAGPLFCAAPVGAPTGALARVDLGWAHGLLAWRAPTGEQVTVIADVAAAYVSTAVGVGPLTIAGDMPLYLQVYGEGGPRSAPGDPSIELRYSPLRWLGVMARGTAPLNGATMQLGYAGPTGTLSLLAEAGRGHWSARGNLGYQWVPRVELVDLVIDDRVEAIAGLSYGRRLGVMAEAQAHLQLQPRIGTSAELMAGAFGTIPGSDTLLRLGVGTALAQGPGTPSLRAIAGVGFGF